MLPLLFALLPQAATPKPIESLPPLVPYVSAMSPDQKRLAIETVGDGVWVLDLASKQVGARVPPADCVDIDIAWSADGSTLAVLRMDGTVAVVNTNDGTIRRLVQTTRTQATNWEARTVALAANDSVLVLGLGGGHAEIWSIASGTQISQLRQVVTSAMSVSRDRSLVAMGDESGTIDIWKAVDGTLVRELRISEPNEWACRPGVHAVDFNADGTILAIAAAGDAARLWRFAADGTVEKLSCAAWYGPLEVGFVRFSRDGSKLLTTTFASFDAHVWDMRTLEGQLALSFCGGFAHPMPGWISSDGQYVAMISGWPVAKVPEPGVKIECVNQPRDTFFESDGDYAWAVVDHNLIVRKIPDEQPILRIAVRGK